MKKYLLITFSLIHSIYAAEYSMSGSIDNKLMSYLNNSSKNYGYYHQLRFEQKTKFNKDFIAINQLRIKALSLQEDIKNKITPEKKDQFETYLGENYFRYQLPSLTAQIGFQEIVWGEAFGFNYADIINPKDNRITFFNEQSESRIPILLANLKYFFSLGSIQLIWSPRPQFSKTLPLDLFVGNTFSQSQITVSKEKTPNLGSENDYGAKLSLGFEGLDLSFSYFNFLDRNPYYLLKNATLSELSLEEKHSRVNSYGISAAKTFFDFVFRTDFVVSQNKTYNYTSGLSLANYQSNTKEILFGFDTPTWEKYTAYFIYAYKDQSTFFLNSLMPKKTDYVIAKILRSMDNEKSFEISYTREINEKANGIQMLLSLPVNSTTELKFGAEAYIGEESSNFSKLKKINNVFINLKNYFQL